MKQLRISISRYLENNFLLRIKGIFDLSAYNIILGPSGSGKTLTLRYIAGLEKEGGKIFINEKELSQVPPQKRNIIYIPQGNSLFPHLSVKDNILFGIRFGRKKGGFNLSEISEILQVSDLLHRYPNTLSAGEKQRIALARAIILKPDILLLDEPLSSLDFHIKLDLINFLRHLNKKLSTSFIHVTHDPIEATLLGDIITIIEEGEIKFQGKWEELKKNPPTPFTKKIVSFKELI